VAAVLPIRTVLRENHLNDFLKSCEGAEGFEFVDKVLDYLNFTYRVVGREIERIPSEGPVLILVNRPLGLADCAALAKLVGEVRRDVRIVANEALSPLAPLRPLLLPAGAVRAALEGGEAVIASGPLALDPGARVALLVMHIGRRHWARFYGLAAFFRRGATLPVRIAEPIVSSDVAALDLRRAETIRRLGRTARGQGKGKLLGFRTEAPIARPEDRLALRRELQGGRLLGHTADGKNIVLFDARPDCAVLRELGRLREIAFRQAGEGTGKRRDIDAFDAYYRHVVLWDDAELQIAGAYRIGEAGKLAAERGLEALYTHRLFAYGDALRACLPRALELGRSFVQPRFQGLRALDYLWQGIGAYLRTRPDVRYLFGPVSLSAAYPEAARRMLVDFFARHYGADTAFATARRPVELAASDACPQDLRELKEHLAAMGVSIPVLYKQYAELCEPGGTRFLAFSVDPAFGDCIDALVLVDLHQLKAAKRERYLGAGGEAAVPAGLLKSA
jgi:putative hemolysin